MYNPEYHRKYYLKNKEKKKAQSKAWKRANPEKARSYRKNERDLRFRRVFGITLEDYERILEEQGGLCVICKGKDNSKRLAVDHCHTTGKVRGLLCSRCNQGLGLFDDDEKKLRLAIKYLKDNQIIQ